MKKIESWDELVLLLEQRERIYVASNDFFILKDQQIIEYRDGSRFHLSFDDFTDLYGNAHFYYDYDHPQQAEIDLEIDEDYYRYFKK